jgi:hypothetical protein
MLRSKHRHRRSPVRAGATIRPGFVATRASPRRRATEPHGAEPAHLGNYRFDVPLAREPVIALATDRNFATSRC